MAFKKSKFDAGLEALNDAARREEAARVRQQKEDRQLAAALSGTFAGTLVELAETGSVVTVQTRTGATIRGEITGLGPDVVMLRITDDSHAVLRRLSIEGLREPTVGHDRHVEEITEGPELAEILDDYSNEGQRLAFTLSTGNRIMGHVDRVGLDQVIITLDGDSDTMTIPLFAIDQVVISP